ncbi:muraminidase [Pseudomonas sp. Choline-3u-10]|uniref:Putative glycoside hydrolase n=1 Tax=viral metagenome TaxID=1070528 RepID=A0A6H1ZK05_9ZZZZ|nr:MULTISPECIES: lysozyme [Pseudomonadaceae]MBK3797549.1 glycoside hydrolase family protein [Stutzerimonas stutzeri]MBK3876388.1 glycoside hydrolase family protein [Stutzerimonas stutzeri]PKG90904.1 muraminidase [Pseudomonas sp. Choline-3u-10]
MQTSQRGIDLIKSFEGLSLTAYKDVVGVVTIGYGTTSGVKMGDKITKERAEELLRDDVKRFEGYVEQLVKVPLMQGQHDALVSFTYNLGPGALEKSTLLDQLNRGDYHSAAEQFGRWVKAGGKTLAGLVRRRAAERALFEEA